MRSTLKVFQSFVQISQDLKIECFQDDNNFFPNLISFHISWNFLSRNKNQNRRTAISYPKSFNNYFIFLFKSKNHFVVFQKPSLAVPKVA